MSRHLLFTTLAFALLAGCGDSLSPDGPTSSSSTTGPGTGGAPPAGDACTSIPFRPEVIPFNVDPAHEDDDPRLAAIGSAGRVALAFERRPAGSTSPLRDVRHTAFEPFGAWPPDVPATVATPSIPATVSVALAANGIPVRSFALTGTPEAALGLLTIGDAEEATFHLGLDPFESTGKVIGVPGTTPMFATHAGETFLIAAQNAYDFLDVSLISLTGGAPTVQSWPWPCSFLAAGFDPYPAEAVPFGDGFLVATSSVFSSGDPDCTATTPPGAVLHRVRAGESPVFLAGLAGLPVAVAPHPEGLWVVSVAQAYVLQRIDGATGAVVVTQALADVGVQPRSVAIAAMGRSLALAWAPRGASQNTPSSEVRLRVLTESGATLGEAALYNLDAPGAMTMAASPDARSVVVAWGQWAGSTHQISMARADCIGGS
jgi:hypothetical protein